MDLQKTSMKENEENIDKVFQNNNIVIDNYKYIDYDINPIILQCSIYDLKNLLNQKAKLRENFSIDNNNKVIDLPNFFVKINGVFDNKKEWIKFKSFIEKDACVFYDFSLSKYNISTDFDEKFWEDTKKDLFKVDINSKNSLLKLNNIFKNTIKDNNVFDILNPFILNYFLKKLDVFIQEGDLKEKFSKKVYSNFLLNVLFLNNNLLRELNSWDFSSNLPRVIIYDEYEKYSYDETNFLLVDFLNYIGIDILILSPSGKSNIESFDFVFNNNLYTNIILDKFISPSKTKKTHHEVTKSDKIFTMICGITVLFFVIFGIFLVNDMHNTKLKSIESEIDSLTNITYDDYEKIEDVKESYDELSEKDKSKISNYAKLESAESQYETIRTEKITEVEDLISSIDSEKSDEEKEEITKKAQKQYDELREEDAEKVTNADELNKTNNMESVIVSFNEQLKDMLSFIFNMIVIIIPLQMSFRILKKMLNIGE